MTSRRNFIMQGALASTAIFAVKPLAAMERATSYCSGLGLSQGKLAFLHTANLHLHGHNSIVQCINEIKKNNPNTILLEAGEDRNGEIAALAYDACINGDEHGPKVNCDYKIIKKGNIKTGIIIAKSGDSDIIPKINALSAYLKKEKKCMVVVCLSRLGYRNNGAPDDLTLANKSAHIDIIVGGLANNCPAHPIIALNRNKAEVIIDSAADNAAAFGKIEIDFDEEGQKKYVNFTTRRYHTAEPAA